MFSTNNSMSVFYTVFCFISTFFIIQLAPTFYGLPIIEQTRIIVLVGLVAAMLALILSLCVAECIGIDQVGQGIDDTLILFISQGLVAVIYGGIDARKVFVYFYFLSAAIAGLFSPRTPLPSTPIRKRKGKKRCKKDKKSATVGEPREEKSLSLVLQVTTASPRPLEVSDTILGRGSNRAVVFEGLFQGRPVAVKRYQRNLISLATREVSILQESNDHFNVVRYFYQESDSEFFYIALDLCPGSLADVIENLEGDVGDVEDKRREEWKDIARGFDERKAMKQIASGLGHLHGLGLVHRDIKPQNILISSSSSPRGRYRMLISDFGLCKKLDVDQSSSLPAAYGFIAAGTAGWRAPEMLQCPNDELESSDTLATSDDTTMSSLPTTINGSSPSTSTNCQCLTKSVDIFALGCLFYYILTNGRHPYGNRFEREDNIKKDIRDLSLIYPNEEARDLITHMLHRQPSQRSDIEMCLLHPFFWDSAKRLAFLRDASNRFEVMSKDPMDRVLIRLEKDAKSIVKTNWYQTLDQSSDRILIKHLRLFRTYDGNTIRDLLRVLRNKDSHYQDLPDDLKLQLGSMPDGFLAYFTDRYPRLLVHVHEVIKDTDLYRESMFKTYFELPET